ncbi:2-(3-amino-3-carboxypropyl)histidine synthase subunit 1 [Plakobranchus ocellatus]|uniref:2-(3-amino-3-carboxypropyl)histidine synthase subunit 1 n=1 Tax=Plakobranchus ocellatus TaxID=259542 RepID=A0AAV4DQH5_9GAST|nr:2-(3-amino-3-carboxypropyl)histidine synthase subunit 1 [Plakobranchus ocellatus]
MAQGKFKGSSVQVPGKKKTKKGSKQKLAEKGVTRKGHFQIAPKKKRLQDAAKLKKDLEKGIKTCIVDDLTAKTVALEPRSLAMVRASSSKSQQHGSPSTSKSNKT